MKFSFLATTAWLSAIVCTVTASPKATKPFGVVSEAHPTVAIEIDAGGALVADGSVPLSQATTIDSTLDAPLLRDIQMLNDILEDIVKKENPKVHKLYHELRKHGLDRAANTSNNAPLDKIIKLSSKLSADEALAIMRTFTLALNLINAAETHHRLRSMKSNELSLMSDNVDVGPLPCTDDSMRGTIDEVLDKGLATKEEIYNQLLKQNVEIVLTAHPTEVNRKTLLRKFRKITETLADLERPDLHPYEKSEAMSRLKRIIASIWGSDEIRRQKPTPQKEASGGNAVIETILWDAVPAYLRKLDAQCEISLGRRLPVETVPIRFASWIGGDRDGNPNVTPEVTREVVTHQRLRAARLFLNDMNTLYNEIAISNSFSEEMNALADTIPNSFDKLEKYRRVIGHLQKRLIKTVKVCEEELAEITQNEKLPFALTTGADDLDEIEPILYKADLMEPLKVMYDSLVQTGYEGVADGLLIDIIRRLAAFGTTLVRLDIREESTAHKEAVDAITQYLGIGSYKLWDEEAKISFLQAELAGKRPLFRTRDMEKMGLDAGVLKTLRVFEMAATLNPEALGAYVISQAQTASDVLAVMLLQKQFGMTPGNKNMMRVVPLFETLNDLINAPEVLDTLFKVSVYTGAVKGKQEVMVGYSDSAKDAGRLAACWAQYNSQEKMVKVAATHNIELTFFHGKGGTVGRGGNPALYRAIMSHPPNTINGRFRVTEQGEMITQNFGAPLIAERSLDIYTAAVLGEAFTKHVEPTEKWRKQMERVSVDSCADYRFLVREEPRFVPYFRQATPELELGTLNIGSRPAKRNPKGGIESLRAIPWTFAWTQTRTHLSAWLGVAAGLNSENPSDIEDLKEMYDQWPWFRETIDLIAMILSKTDFSIAKNYDTQLVHGKDEKTLGEEVREKLVHTRQTILGITQQESLADGPHAALLRASTTIRHPYVDPINVMQAELLKRFRELEKKDEPSDELDKVRDALIVSISGIAQGMRNSG